MRLRPIHHIGTTVCGLTLIVAGCVAVEEMPTPLEGARLYAENCAACHGGPTEVSAPLIGGQVAPDLTRLSAGNDGVFPRAFALSQIDGYVEGSHPNRVMPEFGGMFEGDMVPLEIEGRLTPTPRPLAAVLAYLEEIQEG